MYYFKIYNFSCVNKELDSPAHAGNGWDWGVSQGLGDLALCVNAEPWNNFCGQPPCGQLNPLNPNTFIVLGTF
jgi:hexosaminidase